MLNKKRLGALGVIALFLLTFLWVVPANAQELNARNNSSAFTGTSLTCVLPAYTQYDTAVVAISTNVAVSSVADSRSNTYTSQVSAGSANSGTTEGSFAYLYTATLSAAASGSLTVTVTFGSSTKGGVFCADIVGYGKTAAHTSTGTGTASGNGTTSASASVGSFTPTTGNFFIAVATSSFCGGLGSISYPPVPAAALPLVGSTQPINNVQAGTDLQCSYAGTHPVTPSATFSPAGYGAWNLSATGNPTTAPFTFTWANAIEGCHSTGCGGTKNPAATWAEVAMDLPANTVKSQSVSESFAVSFTNAYQSAAVSESFAVSFTKAQPLATLGEGFAFTNTRALPNPSNSETDNMCFWVTYGGVNTTNTCVVPAGTITLATSNPSPTVGATIVLSSTTSVTVFGPYFIKIFDITNSSTSSIQTCLGTSCTIPVTSHHTNTQQFEAAITKTGKLSGSLANSTIVSVSWGGSGGVGTIGIPFSYAVTCGTPSGGTHPTLTGIQGGVTVNIPLTTVPTVIFLDQGTPWKVSNPWVSNLQSFVPTLAGGIVLTNNPIQIQYSSCAPTCVSTNPFQLLLAGCFFGMWYFTWNGVLGNMGAGFIFAAIAVALYLNNENPMSALLVFLIMGGIFTGILPALFLPIGAIFLAIGVAGSLYQLLRDRG